MQPAQELQPAQADRDDLCRCDWRRLDALLLTTGLCVQLTTALAVLLGRFEVSLAPQMGGWEGCRAKELNAFTLLTIGGNWLLFKPRSP